MVYKLIISNKKRIPVIGFAIIALLFINCNSIDDTASLVIDEDIRTLLDQSNIWKKSNADTTLFYAQKALELSKTRQNYVNIVESLNKVGTSMLALGEMKKAYQYHIEALNLSQDRNDSIQIARSLHHLGRCFNSLGDYDQGLEYFLEAYEIKSALKDTAGISVTANNIGLDYYRLKQYNLAEKYLLIGKKIDSALDDKDNLSGKYLNLGLVYKHSNRKQEAIEANKKSLEIAKSIDDFYMITLTLGNMGMVYLDEGNLTLAKKYIDSSMANRRQMSWPKQIIWGHIFYMDFYDESKNYNLALKHIDSALVINKTVKNKTLEQRLLSTKASIYNKLGNYEQAYLNKIEETTIKDSLNTETRLQKLASVEARLNVLEHENEIIRLQSLQQKSKTRFWTIASFLVLAIALFAIIFLRLKQRAKINANKKVLAEQKAQAKTLENQLLQQNIENQKKDLSNFAITTKQNKDWLTQLSSLVSELKSQNNLHRDKAIKELDTVIKDKQRINIFTEDLQQQVEQLNTDFYHKLNTAFPSLTPYELKLCSLLRINLGTKDIATLLNISPSSVNTSRYRLRKKLQLDNSQDLTEHLKSY